MYSAYSEERFALRERPQHCICFARLREAIRAPAAGNDEKVTVSGACNFRTQMLNWHLCERKNSEEVLAFLRQLLEERSRGKKRIVVLDNAGYHRAKKVEDFFERHEGEIELSWLPPCSPEFTLIKYVCDYLKEQVANNYFFGDMGRPIEALKTACCELASPGQIAFNEAKTPTIFT